MNDQGELQGFGVCQIRPLATATVSDGTPFTPWFAPSGHEAICTLGVYTVDVVVPAAFA